MNYYKLSIFFFYLFGKEEIKVERAVGRWGELMKINRFVWWSIFITERIYHK